MACAAATEPTFYDVDMPQHPHQLEEQRHDAADCGPEVVDDQLRDTTAAAHAVGAGVEPGQEEDDDRQSYPLGQSHTPLTSIPTLGQALIDGNNLDRKYVHSFLQVLADHSQFSDKYQHYEEDEYERKRKRKLRESERKMFFYAGQSVGGASGDKAKRKGLSAGDKGGVGGVGGGSGGASASNKKRRRKERERERERVLDKDARRQLSGSAPMMMSMTAGHEASSPFHSPPTAGLQPERAASMPSVPVATWPHVSNASANAFYSTSVPAAMPSHAQQQHYLHHQQQHQQQQMHPSSGQAASQQFVRHRASMPQLPTAHAHYQPRPAGQPQGYPHYSPSSSMEFMPQPSPLSASASLSSSSYHYTSPAPSPASHIVSTKTGADYAPSQYQAHLLHHPHPHPHHHHHQQQQQSYGGFYGQPHSQRYQPLLATSLPAEMLEAYGGQLTAEEQPSDGPFDEAWASSSSSSSSLSSSASSGELSGSESFSCFGPFDPAALGPTDGGDIEGLACSDMAAAAAAAVESYMLNHNHHHHQLKEESSPEGQQQATAAVDEDWFNSFFSDCSTAGSPFLGVGGPVDGNGEGQCFDSLFADVEGYYGRLVN